MAKQLKTTGFPATCFHVFAIDDDNAITEFVNGDKIGTGLGLTQSSALTVSAATWKGAPLKKWAMNQQRLGWEAPPVVSSASGFSMFAVIMGCSPDGSPSFSVISAIVGGDLADDEAVIFGFRTDTRQLYLSSAGTTYLSDVLPASTVDGASKWSAGITCKNSTTGTGYQFYYAAEGDSEMTAVGAGDSGGFLYANTELHAIGNVATGYDRPLNASLAIVAFAAGQAAKATFDALHVSPSAELFDAPVVQWAPTSTIDSDGILVVGAATAHEAMADKTAGVLVRFLRPGAFLELGILITDPGVDTSWKLRYQLPSLSAGSSLTASLKAGTSTVVTDTTRTAGGTYEMTISEANAATLRASGDVRLRIVAA